MQRWLGDWFLLSTVTLTAAMLLLTCPFDAARTSMTDATAQMWTDTLRIGFLSKVESLNPHLGINEVSQIFYSLIYDSLHSIDNNMGAVPNLALESRIVDVPGYPHGAVWEYNLTANAFWHDGEPLTASDVAWNLNLNCQSENYTDMWAYQPYTYFMKYAETVDYNTVRVSFFDRLTRDMIPCAYGGQVALWMLPEHLLWSYGTSFISFQWAGYFTGVEPKIVGTGPFMVTPNIVTEFAGGDLITLVRNPDYHSEPDRGESIKFQRLVLKFYDDDVSMKIALQLNQIDVAQFSPGTFSMIEEGIEDGSLKNIESHSGLKCTQYWTEIAFNMNEAGPNKWRLDVAARQALAQAVNKTYINRNFYHGYGREGTGLISPVTPFWHWEPTPAEHWDYGLTAAAAALEAAGYVDGPDADSIRECTITSAAVQNSWCLEGAELNLNMMIRMEHPEEKEIAKYLQEQWAMIGVSMTYDVMLEDLLAKNAYSYGYDSMIWYWSSDPDPNFMLFCQSEKSIDGWSDNMYSNPLYEENYSASVRELDPVKRQEYVHNCQRISYRDAAYIVLAYVNSTCAWRMDTFTGWGDWEANPSRSIDALWGANPLYFDLEVADFSLVVREHAGDFRIPAPEDWSVAENLTVEGEHVSMMITGPPYNSFITNILVMSEKDRSVSESVSSLFDSMNETVEELDSEGTFVTLQGSATLWQTANYSAITFTLTWDDMPVKQRIALYANEELETAWVVVCSADSDAYEMLEPCFEQVVFGFEVIRGDDDSDVSMAPIVVAMLAAAVAVAAVTILLLRRKPATSSIRNLSQVATGPIQAQTIFCPVCGHEQAQDNAFCGKCGGALKSHSSGFRGLPPPPT